jgi:hypothetical protein
MTTSRSDSFPPERPSSTDELEAAETVLFRLARGETGPQGLP